MIYTVVIIVIVIYIVLVILNEPHVAKTIYKPKVSRSQKKYRGKCNQIAHLNH